MMPTERAITKDDILARATEKSFDRGVAYFDSGFVESVVQRGIRLFAEVLGSQYDSYGVSVTLQSSDFTASCTCPYDWGGYCKHIVATLLTFINDSDRVMIRMPIEEMLSTLDAGDLKSLVVRMVESNPQLAEVVDSYYAKATSS